MHTPSLGIVQDEINPLANDVRQFIGIPLVQSAISALLFKLPFSSITVLSVSSSIIHNTAIAAH